MIREIVTILVTVEVEHYGLDREAVERRALEHVSYMVDDTATSGAEAYVLVRRSRVSKRRSKIRA